MLKSLRVSSELYTELSTSEILSRILPIFKIDSYTDTLGEALPGKPVGTPRKDPRCDGVVRLGEVESDMDSTYVLAYFNLAKSWPDL